MKTRKNKVYKIQKYDRIFTSSGRRRKKRLRNTVLFVLAVLLLCFAGYSIAGPLSNLLRGQKTHRGNSSGGLSSVSVTTSSEKSDAVKNETYQLSYLPRSVARDPAALDTYLKTIKQKGYNAAVIELKDENGAVYWNTKNEMAVSVGAVSANETVDLGQLTAALSAAEIRPVAQISAFKDKIATKNSKAKIGYAGQPGWSWFDAANGKPWLNPYSAEAQGYITDLACELAKNGFGQILVSGVMFPAVREIRSADFGELERTVSHADILKKYTADLKAALHEQKAELLLSYDGEQARRESNVIYGGADPVTFSADYYMPIWMLSQLSSLTVAGQTVSEPMSDVHTAITLLIAEIQAAHPQEKLIPQISGKEDALGGHYTAEQIDAQQKACRAQKTAGFYSFDKNGSYGG